MGHRCGRNWGSVSDSKAINTEGRPGPLGACWPEICAAMPLTSPDDGGRNGGGAICPRLGAWPAVAGHEVHQSCAHRSAGRLLLRPLEVRCELRAHRDEDESW